MSILLFRLKLCLYFEKVAESYVAIFMSWIKRLVGTLSPHHGLGIVCCSNIRSASCPWFLYLDLIFARPLPVLWGSFR